MNYVTLTRVGIAERNITQELDAAIQTAFDDTTNDRTIAFAPHVKNCSNNFNKKLDANDALWAIVKNIYKNSPVDATYEINDAYDEIITAMHDVCMSGDCTYFVYGINNDGCVEASDITSEYLKNAYETKANLREQYSKLYTIKFTYDAANTVITLTCKNILARLASKLVT